MYLLRPASAGQAHRAKAELGSSSAYVAGGTALQLSWGETPPSALTLIDVASLLCAGITRNDASGLRIGCALRLETLRCDPSMRELAPLLATACDGIASLSVRNVATLGGNIGWRFGDTLAPLLVMGATIELHSEELVPLDTLMARQELPLMLAVHVPADALTGSTDGATAASGLQSASVTIYEKVGRRAAFTPSRIAMALRADLREGQWLDHVCIAATGAGLAARILAQTASVIEGLPARSVTAGLIRDACGRDLPEDPALARIASRVISGHLQMAAAKTTKASTAA